MQINKFKPKPNAIIAATMPDMTPRVCSPMFLILYFKDHAQYSNIENYTTYKIKQFDKNSLKPFETVQLFIDFNIY